MINYLSITSEQSEQLQQEIGQLLKSEFLLKQTLREQEKTVKSSNEELFLEILEIFDALESLRSVFNENQEINERLIQRLPRSLESIQKKLLTVLQKRKVTPIEFQDQQPDFDLCRVVDREIRDDLEEQTITKIVRQGFQLEGQVLRPMEVITSQKSSVQI
jgi:molecular chaperone GrpE